MEEFTTVEHLAIVWCSVSPWASLLHMVTKANGGWLPCGDFRHLKNATTPDRCPVLHTQDFSAHQAGTTVFSKVDLVTFNPQNVPKTVVITPFSLFKFLWLPFSLKHVAQTFQCCMGSVLRHVSLSVWMTFSLPVYPQKTT